MIRVKINTQEYEWDKKYLLGNCLFADRHSNILLYNIYKYDTVIVNFAHEEPNICVFAALCKEKEKQVLVAGLMNDFTRNLLDMADEIEKIKDEI